jgi:hypothetical protein
MIGCVSPVTGGELRVFGMDPQTHASAIKPADVRALFRHSSRGCRTPRRRAPGVRPALGASDVGCGTALGRHEAAPDDRAQPDQRTRGNPARTSSLASPWCRCSCSAGHSFTCRASRCYRASSSSSCRCTTAPPCCDNSRRVPWTGHSRCSSALQFAYLVILGATAFVVAMCRLERALIK